MKKAVLLSSRGEPNNLDPHYFGHYYRHPDYRNATVECIKNKLGEDNSETEFELNIEYREITEKIGFEEYRMEKAPNDHPAFVAYITDIYESMKASA